MLRVQDTFGPRDPWRQHDHVDNITELHLRGVRLTDDAAKNIGRMQWLSVLVLESCTVPSSKLELLCKQLPHLRALSLADSKCAPHPSMGRLAELRVLDLSGLKTTVGGAAWSFLKTLHNLQVLVVGGLSEFPRSAVENLRSLKKLQIVNVEGTRLSAVDERTLRQLPGVEVQGRPLHYPTR